MADYTDPTIDRRTSGADPGQALSDAQLQAILGGNLDISPLKSLFQNVNMPAGDPSTWSNDQIKSFISNDLPSIMKNFDVTQLMQGVTDAKGQQNAANPDLQAALAALNPGILAGVQGDIEGKVANGGFDPLAGAAPTPLTPEQIAAASKNGGAAGSGSADIYQFLNMPQDILTGRNYQAQGDLWGDLAKGAPLVAALLAGPLGGPLAAAIGLPGFGGLSAATVGSSLISALGGGIGGGASGGAEGALLGALSGGLGTLGGAELANLFRGLNIGGGAGSLLSGSAGGDVINGLTGAPIDLSGLTVTAPALGGGLPGAAGALGGLAGTYGFGNPNTPTTLPNSTPQDWADFLHRIGGGDTLAGGGVNHFGGDPGSDTISGGAPPNTIEGLTVTPPSGGIPGIPAGFPGTPGNPVTVDPLTVTPEPRTHPDPVLPLDIIKDPILNPGPGPAPPNGSPPTDGSPKKFIDDIIKTITGPGNPTLPGSPALPPFPSIQFPPGFPGGPGGPDGPGGPGNPDPFTPPVTGGPGSPGGPGTPGEPPLPGITLPDFKFTNPKLSPPALAASTGSPFGGGGAGPAGLGSINLKGSAAPDIYPWSTITGGGPL